MQNNNSGFIFSMTLWLKVPRPCYLWSVGGGLCNSFPMQSWMAWASWGSGLSVSFFIGIQPQVSSQRARLKTAWGNDSAFYSSLRSKVVSFCSWTQSNVVCGLIGGIHGTFCHSLVLELFKERENLPTMCQFMLRFCFLATKKMNDFSFLFLCFL